MRISDLAAAGGTSPSAVRYYERVGLIPAPARHTNGYRDYPPESLARLRFIRTAQTAGLTLGDIRAVLDIRDAGTTPCTHVTVALQARVRAVDDQIAALRANRGELRRILDRAATMNPSECSTLCQIIEPGEHREQSRTPAGETHAITM